MKADKLSQTAAFVAIKFFGLTRIESFRSLFDEKTITFYEKLVQSLPSPLNYYHYWLQFPWVRKLYIWSEELMLPGDLLHVVARKYTIQQLIDNLIDDGYEQIIVLGAGFDHLAYRYAQKDVNAIELDTPYMARLKRVFFEQNYPENNHPNILEMHLPSDGIAAQLKRNSTVDFSKKTVIVAEGFFDYLKSETVSKLLDDLIEQFSECPALVSTHFSLDELPAFRRWVFKSSVGLVGEKLKFDTSITGFMDVVTKSGFNVKKILSTEQIERKVQQQTETNLPLLRGFYILTANGVSDK